MANITTELNQIKNAIYGEDVRSSIVNGLTKMNTEVEQTTDYAHTIDDNILHNNRLCNTLANLGSTITSTQLTNIRNGSFKGMYIGDYWVNGGVNWRIADMNYFMPNANYSGVADSAQVINKPHLIVVPDSSLGTGAYDSSDSETAQHGYLGATIFTSTLPNLKSTVDAVFPNALIPHNVYGPSTVAQNLLSYGRSNEPIYVDLMNQFMVYGTKLVPNLFENGSSDKNDNHQFALFSRQPKYMSLPKTNPYWLKDLIITSATGSTVRALCVTGNGGVQNSAVTSSNRQLRPYIVVG